MEQIKLDIDNSNLSLQTKKQYKSKINVFFNSDNFPDDIDNTLVEINKNGRLNTETNNVSTMLGISKVSSVFKELLNDENISILKTKYEVLKAEAKNLKQEEPNKENDVTWDYLKSLEGRLEYPNIKGDDRLIYRLYISPGLGYIPRNDFSNMKIVNKLDDADDDTSNYYVRENNSFIFNEYKTSNRYGKITTIVPEIDKYISKDKNYMFENGNIMVDANTIGKKITSAFNRLSGGKHITLTTIRRAFATKIKNMPLSEKIALTNKAGHSLEMSMGYSHNLEDDEN